MPPSILATGVEPVGRPILGEVPGCRLTAAPLADHVDDLADVRALCVAVHDEVTVEVLQAAPNLQLVVTRSTGIDNVDVGACEARGIEATALPPYATEAVAELTEATLTVLLRRALEGHARARGGAWDREGLLSRGLRDATVGVVGVGRIGKAVSRRLVARGAKVLGRDVVAYPDFQPQGPGTFAWTPDLATLVAEVDALTLHVPLTEGTHGMIGAEELAALQEGAVLVNTSRGAVVQTDALLGALETGHLGGAHVDVLAGEPEPPGLKELASHPRVLVTPHLGAFDRRTVQDRYELAAGILRERLD